MKSLVLILILLTLNVHAAVVVECEDATCTGDVNAGLTPNANGYEVIINNVGAGTNQVVNTENATSKLLVVDVRNNGVDQSIELDLRTKYNAATATGSASNASKAVVISDTVKNVTVNTSGFNGSNGKSFDQLCSDQIISGQVDTAHGTGALIKTNYLARRNIADPLYDIAAPTGKCDQVDFAYIRTIYVGTIGSTPALCTVSGGAPDLYRYVAASVTGNKTIKNNLRKCTREAFNPSFKQCSYRLIERVWTVVSLANTSALRLYHGEYIEAGARVFSMTSGLPNYTIGWGWQEGPTTRGTITVHERDEDYGNSIGASAALPISFPKMMGRYDNSGNTYDGQLAKNGAKSMKWSEWGGGRAVTATITSESVYAINQARYIATNETCADGEVDRGNGVGAPVPAKIVWIDTNRSCSDLTKEQTYYLPYQDSGVSNEHNLITAPNVDVGNPKTGVIVTTARSVVPYSCTAAYCPGSILTYNSISHSPVTIPVEEGQYGAMHGKSLLATFALTGTVGISSTRGSDGDNGVVPAVAGATWALPETNYCARKEDQDFWTALGNPFDPREHVRFVPEVTINQVSYTPIKFTPPNKVKTTWPAVAPRDNSIYTHVNYGIRKLILDSSK